MRCRNMEQGGWGFEGRLYLVGAQRLLLDHGLIGSFAGAVGFVSFSPYFLVSTTAREDGSID